MSGHRQNLSQRIPRHWVVAFLLAVAFFAGFASLTDPGGYRHVLLFMALVFTVPVMMIRCPSCRHPVAKSRLGLWVPFASRRCRKCGYDFRRAEERSTPAEGYGDAVLDSDRDLRTSIRLFARLGLVFFAVGLFAISLLAIFVVGQADDGALSRTEIVAFVLFVSFFLLSGLWTFATAFQNSLAAKFGSTFRHFRRVLGAVAIAEAVVIAAVLALAGNFSSIFALVGFLAVIGWLAKAHLSA